MSSLYILKGQSYFPSQGFIKEFHLGGKLTDHVALRPRRGDFIIIIIGNILGGGGGGGGKLGQFGGS